jgi:hypothetical protein
MGRQDLLKCQFSLLKGRFEHVYEKLRTRRSRACDLQVDGLAEHQGEMLAFIYG